MGGHGDPYMTAPQGKMEGEIRVEGEKFIISIPNATQKTPEQIGKIAEDLARQVGKSKKP